MRTIRPLNRFKRDYKRETKGKSREAVYEIESSLAEAVKLLADDVSLPATYVEHPLSGTWKGYWDCHLRPDLVLIYGKPDPDTLVLVRLGSHAELFG